MQKLRVVVKVLQLKLEQIGAKTDMATCGVVFLTSVGLISGCIIMSSGMITDLDFMMQHITTVGKQMVLPSGIGNRIMVMQQSAVLLW